MALGKIDGSILLFDKEPTPAIAVRKDVRRWHRKKAERHRLQAAKRNLIFSVASTSMAPFAHLTRCK
ncbi:uncharacterized protein BCR38DRAFT_417546 [Pseudomassariella vexata]|uniref:Uncharacterized protein n=1 Tax=Pseudomassariella vexata TaxID=1141098 RepID=A0A1Y2EJ86_9PEZI|nr:uncharacterized protein BCR38DRAFT_417546 [Pseudomassariella vexata]ORY71620.1 hypothetical protein BCR38DRAFT_417546 [Pseudomassariella vexata]